MIKKRGRKKKLVKNEIDPNLSHSQEADGPVLDLEKSIIKKLIKQGKKDGYLTNELIKKSFPEDKRVAFSSVGCDLGRKKIPTRITDHLYHRRIPKQKGTHYTYMSAHICILFIRYENENVYRNDIFFIFL